LLLIGAAMNEENPARAFRERVITICYVNYCAIVKTTWRHYSLKVR